MTGPTNPDVDDSGDVLPDEQAAIKNPIVPIQTATRRIVTLPV
jgi:hypothetical protein